MRSTTIRVRPSGSPTRVSWLNAMHPSSRRCAGRLSHLFLCYGAKRGRGAAVKIERNIVVSIAEYATAPRNIIAGHVRLADGDGSGIIGTTEARAVGGHH